jgi:hypothetical protein
LSDGRKDHWVQIRISREDEEIIKKAGMTKTEVWRMGFNELKKKLPEKLKEEAEYHTKMSIQCIDKLKELTDSEANKMSHLDKFCLQYIEFERTIPEDLLDLPSQDRNWIEAKIKNHKLQCDVNRFLTRVKELVQSNSKVTNNNML